MGEEQKRFKRGNYISRTAAEVQKRNFPEGLGTYLKGDVVLQTPSKSDRNNTSADRGASGLGTTNLQQIKFLARALAQLRSESISVNISFTIIARLHKCLISSGPKQ